MTALRGRLYCPTPSKRRYALEATAQAAAVRRSATAGIELEAYRCECADFHIRTVAKQQNTRARYEAKLARAAARGDRPWLEWEDDMVLSDLPTSQLVQILQRTSTQINNRHRHLRRVTG